MAGSLTKRKQPRPAGGREQQPADAFGRGAGAAFGPSLPAAADDKVTQAGVTVVSYRPRLLVVCRANQCRSPLTEFLLREAARRGGVDLDIGSAGTAAADGEPMLAMTRATLLKHGITPTKWSSRRLTADLLDEADLILALDASQLGAAGQVLPTSVTRSFTLLQFARLAPRMRPLTGASPREFATALHEAAALARGRTTPPASVDVPDPIGKGRRAFARCHAVIAGAVAEVLLAFPAECPHAERS